MKNLSKLVCFCLFVLISLPVLAIEKCVPYPLPSIDLEQLNAGTGSIVFENVEVCTTLNSSKEISSMRGSGKVIYQAFAPSNRENVSFVANGSHDLNYATDFNQVTLVYTGGPLVFTIAGQDYEVYFQNLTYTLNMSGQVLQVSGGVTVNGVYYDGSSLPYEYFMIFESF